MSKRQVKESLEQRVLKYIKEHRLVTDKRPLVVAVSGGQDSVCLLHLLTRIQPELAVKLHVAHLDHHLRGDESTADAQYVIDLCHRLGIPMTVEQRNVRAYQLENKVSLEEAAREVRYNFFAEVASSVGANKVMVAHTRDDHVETVLLHLLRGSGTRGLRGLQPVSYWQPSGKRLKIIRPLLEISHDETGRYCHHHRLDPRLDTTNLSKEPLRNRVRLELIPLLKSYNPGIVEAFLRNARIAGDDILFLDSLVKRRWDKIVLKEGNTIIMDKQKMLKQSKSIQRYLLRMAMENLLGTLKDIEARHIEEMIEALNKPAGKSISLPEGLFFTIDYDKYLLGREPEQISPYPVLEGEYSITVPGKTEIPGWRIQADIILSKQMITDDAFITNFDFDKMPENLTVRSRITGDRFQPLGMNEPKKVGQFMIDAHVPRLWRLRIPIVCADKQVVWVVGWRIDEQVKVTKETKKILHLRFERIP